MGSHCFAIRLTWMEMESKGKCPAVLMQEESSSAAELRNRVTEMLSTSVEGEGGAGR
jgi:hypothetical protein